MGFDLNNNAGDWFPFFHSEVSPDGSISYFDPTVDAARVEIRLASPEEMEAIYAKTRTKRVEHVFNPKARKMERIEFIDQTPAQEAEERRLTWDLGIRDWEDEEPMLGPDGSPIPKTPENKIKLMRIPVFARFVNRCLELISGVQEEAKQAAEKN